MSGSLDVEPRLQGVGGSALDRAVEQIEGLLTGHYVLSKRAIALLLLQDDRQIWDLVKARDARAYEQIEQLAVAARQSYSDPLDYVIAMRRQQKINELLQGVIEPAGVRRGSLTETLSRWTMHPVTGIPILLLVLYLGLYKFVGQFGAGTVVDFLESHLVRPAHQSVSDRGGGKAHLPAGAARPVRR